MDYEVFLVSRMREAIDHGATNDEAIVEGMANTGAVVTSAALIFIAAVSGLVGGHFLGLQQIGVGLAAGVLIDATVIRGFLLPSAMVLLGKYNWRTK
jgi:RND superfamily putative drug exporter